MKPRGLDWLLAPWHGLALVTLCFATSSGWCQAPAGDTVLLEVKRFVIEGDNPLSPQETDEILAPHLGPHKSLKSLEAAATALEAALRERGYSFHRVIVPAQRPAAGELKLQILRFDLNQITVTGNEHFSAENILRSLPALETGKSPDVRELARELSLANEHPAKRLAINIKESQQRDALDAEVRVRDVPSSQTFIALTGHTRDFDNTINRNTGYTRVTIGHQESNLFDRDHALTLAYTTSPEYMSRVTQLGAFYWIPFYGYNTTLNAYWTRSDVDNGTVGLGGQSFDVSGRGEFMGIRMTYSLPKFRAINHNVSVALDDRFFESNVGFVGVPLPAAEVGSRPLSLRYSVQSEEILGGVAGYVEYLFNIGGGRANDDASYMAARAGAQKDWKAYRFGADANYRFQAGWTLSGKYRAQYADEPLIPGEQFGVGGAASVRGLRERETAGDKGYLIGVEAKGPELALGLAPFVFYDHGSRTNVVAVAGMPNHDSASSIGAGVHWSWQKRLELSATYAHVLNGLAGGTPSGHDQLLFSAFYRF